MKVEFRPPRMEDADALARLSGQLGYEASTADLSNRLAKLIGHEENHIVVACPEGRLLG
ncbi:MAG: hypothetical protein R3B47_13095 [Bacteroidia bacterium]